jgi:hypothetical protein
MAEGLCAPRVESLGENLRGLKARQLELSDAIEEQQILRPNPEQLVAIGNRIRGCIKSGPDGQRKALLQDMVAEIRVQSREAIVPVFRVPLREGPQEDRAVRHLFRLVGPMAQHKNRAAEIQALPINLSKSISSSFAIV